MPRFPLRARASRSPQVLQLGFERDHLIVSGSNGQAPLHVHWGRHGVGRHAVGSECIAPGLATNVYDQFGVE
jgi:hypothetical protein